MNIPLNIDLQQILLHLLNFAILAFGLYFLLYKPVKDFMAKRQAHYEAMKSEAEDCLRKARESEELHAEILKGANDEIGEMRRKAAADAETMAEHYIFETRAQAEKLMADARENALRERDKLLAEAKDEVSEMAVAAVKKLMSESLTDSYDEFLSAAERSEADEHI